MSRQPAVGRSRTVLGMAHAVNYDVPRSMEALEVAVALEPGELLGEPQVRRTALSPPSLESCRGADDDGAQPGHERLAALARAQAAPGVRTLKRHCTRNLSWKMPIAGPRRGAVDLPCSPSPSRSCGCRQW
jgi:hypothetical protein